MSWDEPTAMHRFARGQDTSERLAPGTLADDDGASRHRRPFHASAVSGPMARLWVAEAHDTLVRLPFAGICRVRQCLPFQLWANPCEPPPTAMQDNRPAQDTSDR